MPNALYDSGRQAALTGGLNWLTDDIRVQLVDLADYTADLAAHDNLNDIPAVARVAAATALGGKTAVAGVADADPTAILNAAGDQAEALVLYKHTGTESTSTLIAYIDTAGGLPVLPNTGNIVIEWNDGANKIFRL